MASTAHLLRLYLLDDRRADLDRVGLLIDRLAARRKVTGETPEWWVEYEADDVSAAMKTCAADLDEIDPRWLDILDFSATERIRVRRVDRR